MHQTISSGYACSFSHLFWPKCFVLESKKGKKRPACSSKALETFWVCKAILSSSVSVHLQFMTFTEILVEWTALGDQLGRFSCLGLSSVFFFLKWASRDKHLQPRPMCCVLMVRTLYPHLAFCHPGVYCKLVVAMRAVELWVWDYSTTYARNICDKLAFHPGGVVLRG